ncbi:mechanosensitive ion channel family protein [Gemella morbillorum]|uniref:mechanosensitive ion channel family protein n=1 Tax=Gemella morbillorum TaxID=29391 RepID=UPI001CB211A1|nr:mechanosensitive ion channel domain-containing protein [Gemella morbillorum]MBF1212725.1 mechanosensitive ion channel [Gemella morbillorum]
MNFIREKIKNIFHNMDLWLNILEKALLIVIIIVVAIIGVKILNKIIDYIMTTRDNANKKFKIKFNEKRSETLHKLVKSAVRYTVYFIAFFQILATVGVNTTSIVASAGIASVAIGFGAQNLVKDIISGFFIILEGQFDVGDNVKIYNQAAFIAEGSVLSLGLRSTKIRSKGGEIYFIPNGTINQVINYSLTYNLAICEFPINIETTIEELENEVQSILDFANNNDAYKSYLYKHDKLRLDAIDKIEDNIAYITIVGKAKAGKNSSIETMLRRDFYNVFKDRLKGKDEK